jgi:hypothetical protein
VIRYALCCEAGHTFESWFNNSTAFDRQVARGLVTCPLCGSAKVEKAIMAPALSGGREAPAPEPEKTPVAIVSKEEVELRKKLKELRDHIVKSADYVGEKFPEEARRMHYGEIEHRSIYGEASPDAAKSLAEEGIEFHPLPRLPDERN